MSDDDFRAMMRDAVKQFLEDSPFDEARWDDFAQGISYVPGDLHDPVLYPNLKSSLAKVAQSRQTGDNVLFYLSTAPSLYEAVVHRIGSAGLARGFGADDTASVWS